MEGVREGGRERARARGVRAACSTGTSSCMREYYVSSGVRAERRVRASPDGRRGGALVLVLVLMLAVDTSRNCMP